MPVKELDAEMEEMGYSHRTLRRAKDFLKAENQISYYQKGNKEKIWFIRQPHFSTPLLEFFKWTNAKKSQVLCGFWHLTMWSNANENDLALAHVVKCGKPHVS